MNINNLEKVLPSNLASLTVTSIPYEDSIDYYLKFKSLLEKINIITKPGGICCFFIENTIDPASDILSMSATRSILEILDSQNDWLFDDKIIWIKSPKENTSQSNSHSISMIDSQDNPFTTIYVLVKKGSELESVNFREKAQSLLISQEQKDEISDDFWYIQPHSEQGFTDRIPKELATRLISLFSKENEVVLDLFCGNGIVGLTAKYLNRKFVCVDENGINCKITEKRIEEKFPKD